MMKTKNYDGELDELLELVDPEDLIDWLGVDYRLTRGRSGVQLNIRTCPRCGGSDHKVYLNAESGLGNCFHGSCADEPGFNVFSFTKAHMGGAREAIDELKRYAKTVGWKPRKPRPKPQVKTEVGGVELPKSHPLPINGRNLTYLQARGITADTCELLGLRYCQAGHFEYEGPDGQTRRQDYAKRVIAPVFDLDGQVRTFQGRDTTGTARDKYLFPPGLAGTGQFLYNAHNVIGCETLVIAEGVFDVAATLQAVAEDATQRLGVVGSFGKRLSMTSQAMDSPDQLSQLYTLKQKGLKRVIFLWDGEFKAVDDACREALQLRRFGFDTYVGLLPLDKDPNECTAPEVRQAIRRAFRATPMRVNAERMRLRAARA